MNVQSASSRQLSFTDYLNALVKRLFDFSVASVLLIILVPLFALIAVIMKVSDPGPILFKQKRVGLNGKMFDIYKFRSMVVNAEEKLRANTKLYEKYIQNNYKLEPEDDPRITKLGLFLRKSSLDELPQLINVIKGEMSLVGPRPVVTEELKEYKEKTKDFLSVKPGITGYWQVSGRSNIGYPERVDLELYYVYNQSFWFDIHILFKTFWVVLARKGSY